MEGLIWLILLIGIGAYAVHIDKQEKGLNTPPQQLQCKKCGGYNIQVSMNQYMQQGVSQTTHQKRSLADRTAYNAGRGAMNMMTMGMWGAFTPKRGKYKEITHSQSRTINQKVAICQYCGFSWNIK